MYAAGDNHEHVNMDTDNGTSNCYRLKYRYNIALVLNYPLDSGHMNYAASQWPSTHCPIDIGAIHYSVLHTQQLWKLAGLMGRLNRGIKALQSF